MPTPTLSDEILVHSSLGPTTPIRRLLTRIEIGYKPVRQDSPTNPVGRHSAGVWLDSDGYQGRHRAAEVAAA